MTYSPEIVLLILNGVILILAYFLIYPRTVGNNISKLMQSDLLATATSVIVARFFVLGNRSSIRPAGWSGELVFISVVIFLMMEVPFALWYLKKFDDDI